MLSFFTAIGSGFKWLFDPKNRWLITFILIAAVVALIVIQFNTISNLKAELVAQKTESERVYNNLLAANDTVRNYKLKNGAMRGEITGYTITLEELRGEYKNLFTQFDKTYKEWKNQPPKTIVEYHTTIVEKLANVPTSIITDKYGNDVLSFKHDTTFSIGNSRSVKGLFPINKKYFTKK